MKPYYYVRSGIWDILDRVEVTLPDENFYAPGTDAYTAALKAMHPSDQERWVRLFQTIETIRDYAGRS